eukprot:6318105-Amphidinium_carterae.1
MPRRNIRVAQPTMGYLPDRHGTLACCFDRPQQDILVADVGSDVSSQYGFLMVSTGGNPTNKERLRRIKESR